MMTGSGQRSSIRRMRLRRKRRQKWFVRSVVFLILALTGLVTYTRKPQEELCRPGWKHVGLIDPSDMYPGEQSKNKWLGLYLVSVLLQSEARERRPADIGSSTACSSDTAISLLALAEEQYVDVVEDADRAVFDITEKSAAIAREFNATKQKAEVWLARNPFKKNLYKNFLPQMTPENKKILMTTFQIFDLACRSAYLTYFLDGGSLLGAYRHRSIIPWDDDMDVYMDAAQFNRTIEVLSCLPGYTFKPVERSDKTLWRLYPSDAPGSYPFINIWPYETDEHYLWPLHITTCQVFPREVVFPLKWAFLDDLQTFSPQTETAYLHIEGEEDLSLCRSTRGKGKAVPCEELRGMYPFFKY